MTTRTEAHRNKVAASQKAMRLERFTMAAMQSLAGPIYLQWLSDGLRDSIEMVANTIAGAAVLTARQTIKALEERV